MPPQEALVREWSAHLLAGSLSRGRRHRSLAAYGLGVAYCCGGMRTSIILASIVGAGWNLQDELCKFGHRPSRSIHASRQQSRTSAISARWRTSGMTRSTARQSTCDRSSFRRSYSGVPRSKPAERTPRTDRLFSHTLSQSVDPPMPCRYSCALQFRDLSLRTL